MYKSYKLLQPIEKIKIVTRLTEVAQTHFKYETRLNVPRYSTSGQERGWNDTRPSAMI